NEMIPPAKTAVNARSEGVRGGAPRARNIAVRAATTGKTPSPIVSAPAAQSPYSIIRRRRYPVAISHSCEWAETAALKTIRAPMTSTAAPTQSQVDQRVRHADARPPVHQR